MAGQALFIDLPNFYSHFLESGIDDPRLLRDYFLYWLDFDRLAEKLTEATSSVWVFYSGRKFGPKPNQIQDKHLDEYIERINSLRGVTAHDVDIEGKQRELAKYECEACRHQGVAQWESEKGIDASLIVHLFDTTDSWDVAYLLSGDADFVPAVNSLRRHGKIVIGAGFSTRSSSLVRECYDYIDLASLFLKEDVFAYRIFGKGGFAEKWLKDEVEAGSSNGPVEFTFEWQFRPDRIMIPGSQPIRISNQSSGHPIHLTAKGDIDLNSRLQLLQELKNKYPENTVEFDNGRKHYQFFISDMAWPGVERREDVFVSSFPDSQTYSSGSGLGFSAKYEINLNTGKYETKKESNNIAIP